MRNLKLLSIYICIIIAVYIIDVVLYRITNGWMCNFIISILGYFTIFLFIDNNLKE